MRISDWSSDVCSSDLADEGYGPGIAAYRDDRSTRDAASWDALLGRWRGELATLATEVRDGWAARPEERREGKEWDSTWSSRWVSEHYKKIQIHESRVKPR